MTRFVKKLHAKNEENGSYYNNIWVLHYTEDICKPAYMGWNCKIINTTSATREIKSLPDFEKVSTIYDSMVNIGGEAMKMQNKGQAQQVATMKTLAAELIPCGEELASVLTENVMTLKEWMEFAFDTADICLEKEVQWPVDQDLIY